jgi:hypothetical protein
MSTPYGQPYGGYPQQPPEPSKPIGVAILAVLIGIVAVLFIIGGVLLAALGVAIGVSLPAFGGYGVTIVGIIVLIFGLILLGVALGLWRQRLWALVLAIIFFALYFLSDLLGGNVFSLGAILSLILVIYLLAVHRHFL